MLSKPAFASGIDRLAERRTALLHGADTLDALLRLHGLATPATDTLFADWRLQLATPRFVLAFVGEFSRGKSELINAIFFAEQGARMLPASPGRTTMCPMELSWDATLAPGLALLPVATRLDATPLDQLRDEPQHWIRHPLDADQPAAMAQTMRAVTETEWVTTAQAEALGFWSEPSAETGDDAPAGIPRGLACNALGQVEVPAWRHAVVNWPHPLLRHGLVVIDTPGLNAIGVEPELTLGLLPSAHATVFVLGADTGVTASDLAMWNEHLSALAGPCFIALNKIDTLQDPLSGAAAVAAQIDVQRLATARALLVPVQQIFPLSARQALAARVQDDAAALAASRLLDLEQALDAELVGQRGRVLQRAVSITLDRLDDLTARSIGDELRSLAEQRDELAGVEGKSSAKVARMIARVAAESADFDRCTHRLKALRAAQLRLHDELRQVLATQRLRDDMTQLQAVMAASVLGRSARRAFLDLCERNRGALARAAVLADEIRQMLVSSFVQLNAEFGLSLVADPMVDLAPATAELDLIERNYLRYFGIVYSLRIARPQFRVRFGRMLGSKLQLLLDTSQSGVDAWSKTAWAHVSQQLRDRRLGLQTRQEALKRIGAASGDLRERMDQLLARERALLAARAQTADAVRTVRALADTPRDDLGAPQQSMSVESDAATREAVVR